MLAGAALLSSQTPLRSDHVLISADPLIVLSDLRSTGQLYTPERDFYVRDHYQIPGDVDNVSLEIAGEVERRRLITPSDLASSARHQLTSVLECAGNPVNAVGLASNGLWTGWSLADVLLQARPKKSGAFLHLFGWDGYARSVPIRRAYEGGLLVSTLDKQPLRPQHGSPWRALFPGWYGMDSVKWLKRIVVSSVPLTAKSDDYMEMFKTPSGKTQLRPLPRVQVKSLIVSPTDGSALHQGRIGVRGVAWSGEGEIIRVQVSGDNGARWQDALVRADSRYGWALWRCELTLAKRGAIDLVCRATDARRNVQPSRRDPKRIDGYAENYYHRIRCVVV